MNRSTESRFGLIFSCLVFAGIAGAAFPLLATGGPVHNAISLDFRHIAPWVAVGAAMLLLSRIVAIASSVLEPRQSQVSTEEEEEWDYNDDDDGGKEDPGKSESEGAQQEVSSPLLRAAAITQGALQGLGWATLVSAMLAILATLPATISSARPDAGDVESLESYLSIFGSLIKWVFAAGIFYGLLRTARTLWPAARGALPFPIRVLVVLAVAYILLAGGGVLDIAFDFPGALVLIIFALVLALPYLASVLRNLVTLSLPARVQNPARVLLLVIDIAWIVLVLGIMLSLPGIVGDIPELQPGGALASVGPYLDIFDTLAFWSVILLAPFILVRVIAAFRPAVGEVFGFPMGRIILFALALIGFSDNGIPATASSFPIPKLMPAMTAALVISYLTLILRRVAQLGLPPRVAVPMTNIPPLIDALMPAISASLVVWALTQSFPLISAPLLDNSGTASFGEASLPYFAGLFEVRFALIAFVFLTVLTWALPDPLWTPARLRVRPLVAALGFTAAGCFLWLAMAPLSGVGHVFPLLGAIVGAGLLTLGLSQMVAYFVDSPEPLYSGPARWFTSSRVRGFIVGAALAFYGMLLRPLLYETLWFAAVYEWIVVFALAVWALFRIRGGLKSFVETAEAAPLSWTRWNRHEQQFEDRPDPRRVLVSRWQHRFVESGEWSSLWSYQMGLLSKNNATPQDAQRVFRPLRDALVQKPGDGWLRRRGDRDYRRRVAGLSASLRSTEQVLSNSPALPPNVDASVVGGVSSGFIENGADSELVAATIIAAYRRRGANTDSAVALWFPLVNVADSTLKWFQPPWVRSRIRRRDRERRRKLVEGAISHLSGNTTAASLTVGVAVRRAPLTPVSTDQGRSTPSTASQPAYDSSSVPTAPSSTTGTPGAERGRPISRWGQHQMSRAATDTVGSQAVSASAQTDAVTAGQGFELLSETASSYLVRTSENVVGYVSRTALVWLPILPGDEVVAD